MAISSFLSGRSLSSLSRRLARASLLRPPPPCCELRPTAWEPLENRLLMASVTWDGGGDGVNWNDANNWNRTGDNANVVPGSADDATLDVAANPAVNISTAVTVHSLVTNEALTVSAGGTLAVSTTADVNATLTVNGGTVQGGNYDLSGGSLVPTASANNRISGLTVAAGDIVLPAGARLRVLGGLTLAGSAAVRLTGSNAAIGFEGTQTLSGGLVSFENTTGTSFVTVEGNSTLTLGPTVTVTGGHGAIATTQVFVGGTYSLVNQGTINATVGGTNITIGSTGSFTNTGSLQASGGGALVANSLAGNLNNATVTGSGSQLTLSGNYTNNLGLSAPAGATLTLNGNWSSPGGININGGTLNLGGSFTTAGLNLPAFTRSGGTVNLTGTLNNAGNTLTLDASAGSWNLDGGTLSGGTLEQAGAGLLLTADGNSTLASVTIGSGDIVAGGGSRLRVTGGLTMDAGSALRLTGNGAIASFIGTQTFTGAMRFESPAGSSGSVTVEGTSTLTLAPGTLVSGGRGNLATTQILVGGTYSVVNQGTIQADVSGGTLTVGSTGSFTNSGALVATGGGLLSVTNLSGNLNNASVSGSGSQLTLAGNYTNNLGLSAPAGATLTLNGTWSNPGGINVSGGTLNLGGSFTTAGLNLPAFTRSGGTVNLTGTLNNAGNSLTLDANTGSWNLAGGTLSGGTLQQSGAGLAIGANGNNTVTGLTVGSGDFVLDTNDRLQVRSGLTMAAGTSLRLTGNGAIASFIGTQTFTGAMRFESPAGSSGSVTIEGTGTLTLASGSLVSGGRGNLATTQILVGGTYSLVNQGTIQADVPGATLTVGSTGSFTNPGSIRAAGGNLNVTNLSGNLNTATLEGSGSQLTLAGSYANNLGLDVPAGTTLTLNGSWSSPGGIDVNGGTLNLGGSFTTAGLNLPAFTRSGGTVNLTGTLNNAGNTLTLDANTGSWNLDGGTLSGGTLEQAGASLLLTSDGNSTFNGVTVGSGDVVAGGGGRLQVRGGLTMDTGSTLRLTGNSAFVSFMGTQTFTGAMRFESPAGSSGSVTVEGAGTLTLAPGTLVSGGRGNLATTQIISGGTYSVVNQGTIQADVSGGTLTVGSTGSLTNPGTLVATGGGLLSVTNLSGNLNNASVSGSGSQLTLAGNYTNNLGLSAPAGATLTLNGTWSSPGGLSAVGGTLVLGGSFSTAGLNLPGFTRSGGTVNLAGTLNNAGNTLTLDAHTGPWNLDGGTINGGTLQQSGASLQLVNNGGSTLSGVTVGSGDLVLPGNAKLRIAGGLSMAPGSAIRLTGGNAFVSFMGSQTLASGVISFENPSGTTSFVTVEGAGTLTLAPGVMVRGGRGNIATTQIIVGGAYGLANQGTIESNVSGATIAVGSGGSFTNAGALTATGGGRLSLVPFTNNGGTLTAGAGSTVDISGTYTQSSGATVLQGGTIDPTGSFNLQGGTLSGAGTIKANLSSAGEISPGGAGAAGNLRVEGTYAQSATGVLDLEVGGPTAGTQHDRLEVTGAATLDGTLNVAVINGYQAPSTGIIYGVLPYASRTGSFQTINGLAQPNGRSFTVDYGATRFALVSDVSDTAGPVVVSSVPTGLVNTAVASLRLQFNEPVAPASFTRDDVAVTTPAGPLAPSLVSVVQVDATTFDVQFPSQTLDGNYSVAVGPNVTDLTGNPMPAVYTATFTVDQTGPRVVSVVPSGDINPPLTSFDVTFDSEIDSATFQTSDVSLARPTGTPIAPSSITRLSANSFRLNFSSQSAPGTYTLTIGPDVRDLAGNLMDQDADGVRGEAADDKFTSTTTVRAVDLQVTGLSVTGLPSMQSGANVTVAWNDTNGGNGATGGSWSDRVLVVNTTTGQTLVNTTVFYDANSLGAIPAGGSRARQHVFKLADGTAGVGDLQVTVTADTSGQIPEVNGTGTGETNNSASTTVTSVLAAYPDLQVTGLSVTPPGLQAGQVMTVSWNDANAGNGATAASWNDKIVVRNLTTNQTLLNTTLFYDRTAAGNGDIPAGASRARQYQFHLPDGDAAVGQLQVEVTADTLNAIFEFNGTGTAETNNVATTTVNSTLAPYPDIVPENLSFTPVLPTSGQSVTVKWSERNAGNAAVGGSSYTRVRVTRAADGSSVADQVLFFSAAANASLTAGGTADRQFVVKLPDGPGGSGTFNVQITADNYNQVFEHNAGGTAETNNVATGAFSSSLAPYPDLTVAALAVTPTSPHSGQQVTIDFDLANSGNGPVTQPFHYLVQVVHVPTGQSLYSRVEQYDTAVAGPIAAGQSKHKSATFTLPDGMLGTGDLQVTVRADHFNAIFEHNAAGTAETNNQAQSVVTSAAADYPDLRVSGVTVASGTVKPGDQVLISWTLTNGGNKSAGPFSEKLFLSSDANAGGDDLLKTVTFDATINPGQSVTRNALITVPAFGAGQRWLVVQTDSAANVFETDETNNIAVSATPINIPLGLAITATATQLSEGGAAANITVSRNGPTTSALVINLANTQPSSLTVPATMTIPAGSATVTFPVIPVNNTDVDGSRTALISATAGGGYAGSSLEVSIGDDDVPTLSVQLSPNPVSEGEGAGSLRVRVFRNTPTAGTVTVHLSSDDPLRASVPATATIPAGAAFVDVFGDVKDNVYIDGLRSIGVTASATGFTPGTDHTLFLDNDVPTLSLSAEQTTISEASGTFGTTGTVSRAVASPIDLYVQLTGGNGNLLLPTFVKILAFQTSASFPIGTINNTEVSADRTVVLTARAVDSFTKTPMESGKAEMSVHITEDDGPALTVTTQTPAMREDGTGTVRVRRNTGSTGNLTVSLTSSDTSELTVPPTAVIPDGAAFVDVTVHGVQDAVVDGGKNVTVSAAAIGFGGGSAVITVTDSDMPDLAVTNVTVPAGGETGQTVSVSYTVSNQGVVPATGSWTDRVFVSDRPVIDDRATQVRQFIRNTPLGVGGSYSQSFEISLPSGVGSAYILVQTDYVDGIPELREANNTAASSPITVGPAYSATVQADKDVYGSGQPVRLTGLATRTGGGPAAFEFVKLHVLVNNTERTLTAFTAADGTYQTTFQPLTTEAGNYQVAATHPGVATFTPQDSFTIAGMKALSDSLTLTPDFVLTRSGQLVNRSNVPITGIQATVLNVPDGLQVTTNVPSTLPGNGSVTFLYSLLATKSDLGRGTVTIRLTSSESATLDVPVTVDVVPLTASLVTTPGSLEDGMLRGQRKTLDFAIRNTGSAASGAITVALPSFPWMRLISPAVMPSLDPGASANVSIELNPAADLPLQVYTGQIAINSANGAIRGVGFNFRALSTALGDVHVSVVDDYTFYVEGSPKVGGATVGLYDPFDGHIVAGGATDDSGNVTLPNVPEGAYQLEVYAPQHGTFRARFDVKPGVTNEKEVFIERQLVTYSWTVVPVDIQDTYKVSLQPTFETNVPVPVVTVEDALVMPLVVEDQWTQFNITLTNHGLIAAKGVKILLPQSQFYEFRVLVDDVGDIPAKTTIQVPVQIRGKTGVTAAEQAIAVQQQAIRSSGLLGANQGINLACLEVGPDVPCLPKLDIDAVYYFECGNDNRYHGVPVSVEPVCVAKDIYECLKQAWGTAAESLPSLGGNLANAPCALLDLILQCADTGLSDCKKALLKAACRGITGALTGGLAGAAAGVAGSIGDLLGCLCDLFNFDFDIGDVELRGGGFSGGGYGGGYLNAYGGGSGGSFTTSGCSPASGSSSTGSSPVLLAPNADGSGVCAKVTLRIDQQAVLTRTGFAGTFTLTNGTAADTLSGIRVDLDIRDSTGNSANSKFGFRDPDVFGMGNVSGTGVLAGGQTGTARYLFVPTRDAAPTAAQTYHIGGTLRYIDNGIEVEVPLIPATITVHPDALLSLDYFLQRDVFSDDPFTEPVEPSDPFTLGVVVNNSGAGKARNFHIVSGQPEIIENEKGLLIDFKIIGTQVGDDVVSPSLTATFGDILAGSSQSARWLMTSTLQGHFIDYKASFEHVDDFGNPRTSLIDNVLFHELEHALRISLPGKGLTDDGQFDFLANDIPDADKMPDMLYFSSGGKAAVQAYTNATTDGPVTGSDLTVQVTAPSVSAAGWSYFVFPDPGANFVLKDVIRSDGSHLKVGDHAWTTDRVFGAEGKVHYVDQVHLLDLDSTGSYTLVYGRADEIAPAVAQLGPVTPGTRSTPVDSVNVTFTEKLAAGSFDLSDVTLTRNGTAVTLTGVASIVQIDDTHYSVSGLSGVTAAAGSYVLSVIGGGVSDPGGNAGSGTTTVGWTTVADAPVVQSLGSGLSPLTNGAVGQVLVSFSKAIDASTFGIADVTLTRNGAAVALASPATITQLSATDFRIEALAGFTAAEGAYVVSVDATGITDTSGNAGAGSAQASWTVDATAPSITFLETLATNPRNIAVLGLDVEFSEAIDTDTLSAADVTLTRDGGADLLNSGLTWTQVSPTRLRLTGFTSLTGVQGTYVFTINGAGITDPAGNAVSNSLSTSWVLDTAEPGAPTNLAITPDNGSSSTDGRTNVSTVTLTGAVPEAGSAVRVVDLTTNTNFGAAATTGNTFSKQLTFAASGAHRLRVYAVDGAGNVSGDVFFDVFIDLAKPTVQSLTGFGASRISVPVNELTVTFNKPIAVSSFTTADVTLKRDGAAVDLSGASVVKVSPTVFTISGLTAATTPLGTYVLTVDVAGISDDAGNTGAGPYAVQWEHTSAVASIGDTVFNDANFNGMQDTGELGAAGVTVRLYSETGTLLRTTTTDSAGKYNFDQLDADARYFVEFVAPAGYGFTHANVSNDASDSDADVSTGRTEVFDVAVGGNTQWDAGIVQLGSISGSAYEDANNNHQRDAGENPLAGFTVFVDLNRNNQRETTEPTAVTAADGSYRFNNLRPGTYVVAMEVPAGWQQTTPDQAGVVVSIQSANLTPTANLTTTAAPETPVDGFTAAQRLIGLDDLAADPRFSHLTGAGYTVVVIDTGIDLNNPFFGPDADGNGIADRIAFQYDFGANDASAQDLTGHGTHIASIIGSGDATYRGVAPGVQFVVFKIFDDGGNAIFGQAERALQWVTNHVSDYKILAVNMSFGDGRNWDWPDATDCGCGNTVKRETYGLGDELATLRSMNVITSAAAGNNFYEVSGVQGMNYPAADPATISVGAVWDSDRGGSWAFSGTSAVDFATHADAIAAFSQRQSGYLDVFAPGAVITGAKVGGGLATMQGTSQATAFVSGAAVLVQQLAIEHLGRRLTLAEFRTLLQTTGVTVFDGDDENDNVINTGQAYSRLDLYAMAKAVMAMTPGTPADDGAVTDAAGDPSTSGQGYAYQIAIAPGGSYTSANFGLRTARAPELELGNNPLQDKVVSGYAFQRDVAFADGDAFDGGIL